MSNVTEDFVPRARQTELVVEELSDEVLIYDLKCNKAHCLGHTAAVVWKFCDGKTSLDEVAARASTALKTPVTVDVVAFALEQLRRADLLESTVSRPVAASLSRRDLFRRAGAVAAAAVVTSIVAPTAAQAASLLPSGASCTSGGQCQSPGICDNGACM